MEVMGLVGGCDSATLESFAHGLTHPFGAVGVFGDDAAVDLRDDVFGEINEDRAGGFFGNGALGKFTSAGVRRHERCIC